MEKVNAAELPDEQRRMLLLVFQMVGVIDIALGAVIAALGPGFVGGELVVNMALWLGGGVLALSGVGMIWFGRWKYGVSQDDEPARQVVRLGS